MVKVVMVVFSALSFFASGSPLDQEWLKFQQTHNKHYEAGEEEYRHQIFKENLNLIRSHNLQADMGIHPFRLGVNHFADLTAKEYKQILATRAHNSSGQHFTSSQEADLPDSIDWREKGIVTSVKDQGSCGSCWAFSAVASLESQHALKSGRLEVLSEQQLVDCSGDEGNEGCHGGFMDQAFMYLQRSGGIVLDSDYPYEALEDECRLDQGKIVQSIKGYVDVKKGSEMDLQKAVATIGPVSVTMDAGSYWLMFYKSGVYEQSGCGTEVHDLNHGVTVVGYGTDAGKDFWLIKNSWGTGWGDKGYLKLRRNHNNMCGVATVASYPVL